MWLVLNITRLDYLPLIPLRQEIRYNIEVTWYFKSFQKFYNAAFYMVSSWQSC